jgi:hypothetical protein
MKDIQTLHVLQATSLRGLVEQVTKINSSTNNSIKKEDIISITKDEETYFLIYFK